MNNPAKNNIIRVVAFFVDIAVIFLCFIMARRISELFYADCVIDYRHLFAFEVCVVFFFFMFDLYGSKEDTRESTLVSIILSAIASAVCVLVVNLVAGWNCRSFVFWIAMPALLAFMLEVWRLSLSLGMIRFREKKKILIIESDKVTSRLARKIKYSCNNLNSAWYYLANEDDEEDIRYLLEDMLPAYDSIFVSPAISEDLKETIFQLAMRISKNVSILATASNVATMRGAIRQFGDTPVIEEKGIRLTRFQHLFKRGFDIAFSVAGIIITMPIFLVCAVAIKLDSVGPVFYTQERYTIYKRVFKLYKFRTMVQDAEKYGAQLSTKNDPRITRVGKIIRMTRLDELPQLFNILGGSMSVVGPRPERPVFADEYCNKVKNYRMRYYFKAGLTGYAQVYGKYNTRASDKILLDLIYAIEYSFWLDIKLVLLTIKTMFIRSSTDGEEKESEALLNTPERERERKERSRNCNAGTAYEKNDFSDSARV